MKSIRGSYLLRFLFRKIVFYVAAFFISLSIIWILPRLMPGDPIGNLVSNIIGGSSGTGDSLIYKLLYDNWVLKFGLNRPLHEQYFIFLGNMLTFSFGPSIASYPTQALDLVWQALTWSLALLVPPIIIGFVIGLYVGAAAAYKKGIYDKILYPAFLAVANTPYYWFALILITLLTGSFRVFPPGGAYSVQYTPGLNLPFIFDFLLHYTLPFLSLLIPYIGKIALGTRAMVLYEIGSDYMDYSESLGFSQTKLMKYALRNALLPSLSSLPMHFGATFAGQVVSEVVFGYPGVGFLLYEAILNQDYNVIQCGFTFVVLVVLLGNFLMDFLYAYVDPRIRLAYKGEQD